MRPDDPKTIESILKKMDEDCAIRSVLSVLGGRKKFAEQFAIECGIMATRTKAKAEEKLQLEKESDLPEIEIKDEE